MSHDQNQPGRQSGPVQIGIARPRTTQPGPPPPRARRSGERPVRKTRPRSRFGPVLAGLGVAAVVIVLFLFGEAAQNFGRNDPGAAAGRASGANPAKGSGTAAKAPGLGAAVRDGKLQFVVSRVDCSKSSVGFEHLTRTAAGRYCVVSLLVKNIGDKPQLFLGGAQKGFDAAGTKLTDDQIAGLYANRDTETFLRKIDPGHQVAGKIVFDVPKAAALTTIELHDSPFSDGVKVTLK